MAQDAKNTNPLIVVDMDDVLSQTNLEVLEWHNETYGTALGMDDYHYFHYWKNEHWGTPQQTMEKLKVFFATTRFSLGCRPIPYALEGLTALRGLGYRLIIVTARNHDHRQVSEAWIENYFPGIFEDIIFTSAFAPIDGKKVDNPWAGKSKAEVIRAIGGVLLIDDSLENALACAHADPPIPVLLFGEYEWNKRASYVRTAMDRMSRAERIAAGDDGYWEREVVEEVPKEVTRVGGWKEVVDWIHAAEWHRGIGRASKTAAAITVAA